jgi:VanZ family protein
VPKLRAILKFWLPPLVWMVLIFTGSSDTKSYQHSAGLVEPILHWLFPHLSQAHVEEIHHLLRKCAHLTEYGVLALLLWRAVRQPVKNDSRPWNWAEAGVVLSIVFLYGATDEFHQIFVPTRTPHLTDVMIDTCGGAVALLALWFLDRWRKYC